MPRNRFVSPETVRLELSDGDWIEVKRQLSYGEHQRLANAGLQHTSEGGSSRIELKMDQYYLLRLAVWLVDWSFRDAKDKPVRVTMAAIEALDAETAAEIHAALDAHADAVEQEKKATSAERQSVPTS